MNNIDNVVTLLLESDSTSKVIHEPTDKKNADQLLCYTHIDKGMDNVHANFLKLRKCLDACFAFK